MLVPYMPDWRKLIAERLALEKLDPASEAEVIEELAQHLGIRRHRDVLIGRDLGVAMRQEIHRNAAADLRQPSQLVPP